MSEVIWGMATSHVPSIGAAMDRGETQDPFWKPLFDGYQPAREWMAQHTPDTAIVVYNDHANGIDLDFVPTFGLGTAERYEVADEGFGRRPVLGQPRPSRGVAVEEVLPVRVVGLLPVHRRADRGNVRRRQPPDHLSHLAALLLASPPRTRPRTFR